MTLQRGSRARRPRRLGRSGPSGLLLGHQAPQHVPAAPEAEPPVALVEPLAVFLVLQEPDGHSRVQVGRVLGWHPEPSADLPEGVGGQAQRALAAAHGQAHPARPGLKLMWDRRTRLSHLWLWYRFTLARTSSRVTTLRVFVFISMAWQPPKSVTPSPSGRARRHSSVQRQRPSLSVARRIVSG